MQAGWRWCKKCQGLAFSLNEPSVCPAGGSHDHSGSGNYALAVDDPSHEGQSDWRWCKKCQGLAFSLAQPSVCPAGGKHDHSQSGNYTLAHNDSLAPGQSKWRWCKKCQGLAFSLNQPSVCPAGGHHDHSQSGDYTLRSSKDGSDEQPLAPSDFANPDFLLNQAIGKGRANIPRDVVVLQRLLDTIPHDRGGPSDLLPLSGVADKNTLDSIKRFQSFMKFPPTGAVVPLDATHVALIQSILGWGLNIFGRDKKDAIIRAALYSPHKQLTYFFKNDTYIRYSVEREIAEPYHERMMKAKNRWDLLPFDTVDAALWYPPKQKAYFFRKDKYVRYRLSPEGPDFSPTNISPSWGKLWGEDIDAALWWPDDPASNLGPGEGGVVFFFKRDEYVKFDPELGRDGDVVPGYPKKIRDGWPGIWPDRIDSAIWWPPTRSAYFFRGDSYLKWDRMNTSLGPDGGVPPEYRYSFPIRAHWEGVDQFAVFASGLLKAPLVTPCIDARPGGRPPTREYDFGDKVDGVWAQSGWDLGMNFASLDDLVDKLVDNPAQLPEHKGSGRIVKNQVTRLAMLAHGANNRWEVMNRKDGETELNEVTLPVYARRFQRLGEALTQRAVVLFVGCNLGAFDASLLMKISKLLPGRLLVGFKSHQHVGTGTGPLDQFRRKRGGPFASHCDECGVKDTPYFGDSDADRHIGDWEKWPWASEYSEHAVLIRDGQPIPSSMVRF